MVFKHITLNFCNVNIDAQNFHRKLGIFPEINQVWVTIDQEFFLWDYSEG